MLGSGRLSLSQTWQTIRRISRILWVRVALISVLSIVAAFSASFLDPLIPDGAKARFTQEATLPVLDVLASSMLAVATFSLGIMVSSHRTLAEQSTPRIHQLLMEDTSTQSVLATFIGAFVYALSAIILFRAGYYDENAAVIVFWTTSLVILAIVVSLVRWIGRLSRIGGLDYALDRAEASAREVLTTLREWPRHGANGGSDRPDPEGAQAVRAQASGHVVRLQLADLQELAEENGTEVVVDILPGDHVLKGQSIARLTTSCDADFARFFAIAPNRSHEQDPRYALQALRESAAKALSPGINDPGTAIDVVHRLERLLWLAFSSETETNGPLYDRIYLRDISREELLTVAFRDIARDGRSFADVLIALAEAVQRLGDCAQVGDGARALLDHIDAYAEAGLLTEGEKARFAAARQTA